MVYSQWLCTVLGAFGQFVLGPSLPASSISPSCPPFSVPLQSGKCFERSKLPYIEFQQVSGEIKVSNMEVSRAVGVFRMLRLRFSCQPVIVTSQDKIDHKANI